MKTKLALLLLALTLSACKVGDGNRPESMRFVVSVSDQTTVTEAKAYECFTSSITLLAEFTDGIPGDFTPRATYTSSNPDVLKVSNGDLPVPGSDGLVYNRGILMPVKEGIAVVTATFSNLSAQVTVTVREPESLVVSTEEMTDSDGVTKHGTPKMVPGSIQQLVARAEFDDGEKIIESVVTTIGEWSTDADEETATIGATTGIVSALKVSPVGLSHTATVNFPPCSGVDGAGERPSTITADNLKTTFEVREPARNLVLVTEPGYAADGGSMPVGTAQFVRVLADFDTDADNGEGQDLTFKGVTYDFEPESVMTYSTLSGLLLAGAIPEGQTTNGPTTITASFNQPAEDDEEEEDPLPVFTSEPLHLGVFAATLDSISIEPAAQTIDATKSFQFKATGKFTVGGVAGAVTLPVNHDVRWSINNDPDTDADDDHTSLAAMSNFASTAGTAVSLKNEGTEAGEPIIVKATNLLLVPETDDEEEALSASAELTIVAPDDEDSGD